MSTMKKKTRRLWTLTSVMLLTISVVTTLSCVLAWMLSAPDVRYLILLDAGSVHTSVYTYRLVIELLVVVVVVVSLLQYQLSC